MIETSKFLRRAQDRANIACRFNYASNERLCLCVVDVFEIPSQQVFSTLRCGNGNMQSIFNAVGRNSFFFDQSISKFLGKLGNGDTGDTHNGLQPLPCCSCVPGRYFILDKCRNVGLVIGSAPRPPVSSDGLSRRNNQIAARSCRQIANDGCFNVDRGRHSARIHRVACRKQMAFVCLAAKRGKRHEPQMVIVRRRILPSIAEPPIPKLQVNLRT